MKEQFLKTLTKGELKSMAEVLQIKRASSSSIETLKKKLIRFSYKTLKITHNNL